MSPIRVEVRDTMFATSSVLLEVFDGVTGKHIGSVSVQRRGDMSPENFARVREWLEREQVLP